LLPRLFDVQKGSIVIDGIDIRDFSIQDLRKQIAIVSQDIFLFNDTVEENIRCGRLHASFEEIQKAAQKAHAIDFIEKLSLGFQTIIGDRGQKLSGGERQRLSIARAFLSDAPILVLDEATSSLDSVSERAVQEALEELMTHRTTLIISHRLSTIQHAGWIVVLEQGSIVEQGKHEDLLKLQGRYYQFHKSSQMT
jgi:ABC-type multidrug transport system fused ATPase/permease subunit